MMSFSERRMERGMERGRQEGAKKASYKFILNMHKKGMTIRDMAEIYEDFDKEQIKEIIFNGMVG